jgi:hypothetical protein
MSIQKMYNPLTKQLRGLKCQIYYSISHSIILLSHYYFLVCSYHFSQFTYPEITENTGDDGMIKWLARKTNTIWAGLFAFLALYILFKSSITAFGWVKYQFFNTNKWLGADLSQIDWRVGIGSIAVWVFLVYLLLVFIHDKPWKRNKKIKTINEDIKKAVKQALKEDRGGTT